MLKVGPFSFRYKYNSQPESNHISTHQMQMQRHKNLIALDETIIYEDKKIHLITGDSGAGKSTYLNLLNSNYLQNEIHHFTGQQPLYTYCNNQQIAYLFQNPFNQIIHQNAHLELAFTAENLLLDFYTYQKHLDELIEKFNIKDFSNKKIQNLSHGEAQKLLLISILVSKPRVLLLDEPTAFMDTPSREYFYELLQILKNDMMIMMIDHHLTESLKLADTVTWLDSNINILNEETDEQLSQVKISYFDRNSEHVELLSKALNNTVPINTSKVEHNNPTNLNIHEKYKIDIRNLSYNIGKESLLENIDLHAESGQVLVIQGDNGAGKSTLFKLIAGLIQPTSGTIQHTLNNQKIKKSDLPKHIGYILQNTNDNFFFDTLVEEFPNTSVPLFIDNLIQKNDLYKSPFVLSEGQKRRASIQIQLNLQKKLILYDEPTYGQDYKNITNLIDIILKLKTKPVLQIIISHDNSFITSVATECYELRNKQLILKKHIVKNDK